MLEMATVQIEKNVLGKTWAPRRGTKVSIRRIEYPLGFGVDPADCFLSLL